MYSIQIKNGAWRIDEDGFLRVTARILQAGIYPYAAAEMPPEVQAEFPGKSEIRQRILSEEFTDEALASLEGKPVLVDAHEWQTTDDRKSKELRVGSIAGKPVKDGDGAMADLLVTDPEAIKKVQSGELQEVSAGYESLPDKTGAGGEFDATQRALRFNHVLLLPAGRGRCGPKVRILNDKTGAPTMVTRTFNSKSYQFTNEADAAEADKMVKDGEEVVKSKDEKIKELNATVEGHVANLTKIAADLTAAQQELAKFTSEENQESQFQERSAFENEAKDVVGAEKEDDKKKLKEALGNDDPNWDEDPDERAAVMAKLRKSGKLGNCKAKTMNERKKIIVIHVMNSRGVDASKYGDAEINATFRVLAATAKQTAASRSTTIPMPTPRMRNMNSQPNEKGQTHPVYR